MFGGLDYGVLAGYFVLCALVGWWTGRGQKTAGEYFKGGGQIPTWAVCLSILASETSALTFCSVPGMAYKGDYAYFQFVCGNLIGRLLVAFLFIPAFYAGGVTSVYEFLGTRFGPKTRALASLLFFVTRILASGVRLTIAAVIVNAVTGWPFVQCVVAFTAVTVAYTVYGGIKSIIWTDVLQFFLFIGGAALALGIILSDIGTSGVRSALGAGGDKTRILHPGLDFHTNYTILTALLAAPILTFATHGTDQDLVQRMLTCKGSRQGSMSVVFSGLVSLPMVLLFLVIGTLLYAFYFHHPDLRAALPGQPDRVFPWFIVHQLPAGLKGLVIAGVFAAAMSTTSSAIGALALVAVVDGVKRFSKGPEDPARDLKLSRILSALISLLLVAAAIGFQHSKSLLDTGLEVMTYTYGALLGVFCLGRLFKTRGSDAGNLLAMGVSVAAVVAVKHFTTVAWPWYTVVGFATTFAIGALFPTSAAYRGASEPRR